MENRLHLKACLWHKICMHRPSSGLQNLTYWRQKLQISFSNSSRRSQTYAALPDPCWAFPLGPHPRPAPLGTWTQKWPTFHPFLTSTSSIQIASEAETPAFLLQSHPRYTRHQTLQTTWFCRPSLVMLQALLLLVQINLHQQQQWSDSSCRTH